MPSPEQSGSQFPERYVPEEMHGLIEVEHLARYTWATRCAPGRRVLDAGCGVGYGSLLLLQAGATSVTGVDLAPEAIAAATRRTGAAVEFRVGDIASLDVEDESFDLVVCFETIEHVLDQERALDELQRVLTPEGLLLVSSPNRGVYEAGNPHHTHEFTPPELRATLERRFAHVQLVRQHAWLTALICDDQTLAGSDLAELVECEARKVTGLTPGSEKFTLAIASDAGLVQTAALALLGGLGELDDWQKRARSAEAQVERSHDQAVEASRAYASIQSSHEALAASNDGLQRALAARDQALEAKDRQISRQERHLNRTSTLLAERNAALDIVETELAEERHRLEELEQRLRTAHEAITGVTGSISWRSTAPLRALARVVRGRRDRRPHP